MKRWSLFLLRLSIGLLVFWWGLDKVTNVEHALQVSETFYAGLLSHPAILPVLGGVQMLIAVRDQEELVLDGRDAGAASV